MMWSYSSSSSSSVSWRITMAEIERQQRIMLEQHNQMVDMPHEADDACATASTSSMVDAAVVEAQDDDHDDVIDKDNSNDCPWPSWPWELMAVLGVLLLGTLAITLVVLKSRQQQNYPPLVPANNTSISQNDTSPPTGSTTTTVKRPVPDFNRAKYRKQIQSILQISNKQLANNRSATTKAFQWIVHEDSVPYNYTDFQLIQRFALVVLHYSTGYWNPYKGGWGRITGTRTPECEWVGVACDEQFIVRTLELSANVAPTKLMGRIPEEIHWLQSLQSLALNDHQLTGQLPSGLYLLRNLASLDLSGNRLNSTISPWLGNLTHLAGLDLSNNSLVGTIPPELGRASKLRQLFLSGNRKLTGTVPTELGELTMLQKLELEETDLEGNVPRQICNLVAIGQLSVIRATCSIAKLNCTCCNRCV